MTAGGVIRVMDAEHEFSRMALDDGNDSLRPSDDEIADAICGRRRYRASNQNDLLPEEEDIAAQITSPRELDQSDTEANQIVDALFNRQTPKQREAARTAQSDDDADDWFGKDFRPRSVTRTYMR